LDTVRYIWKYSGVIKIVSKNYENISRIFARGNYGFGLYHKVSEECLKARRVAKRPTLLGLAAWAYISPCGLAKPVMAKEWAHGPQEAPKAPKGPLEDPSMEAHEGDVLGQVRYILQYWYTTWTRISTMITLGPN
jgi:hypothetical protein